MNNIFKYAIVSSGLLSSAFALAVPVFKITPSNASVIVQPGTTTPEIFTIKNNMAVALKVTNIKQVSSVAGLQIKVINDDCTGKTLAPNNEDECSISTNLISANTNQVINGSFNLHVCIDDGAQCSAIPDTNEPKITIDPEAVTPTPSIIGGRYQNNSSSYLPMLAISSDDGITWAYKIEQNINLPTDYVSGGRFNSVNCGGGTCVAGGEYDDSAGKQYPMLATSFDGGVTWSYKIEKNIHLPTNYDGDGSIYHVNCSGATCIAGGRYNDVGGTEYPMLATSVDGGITWTYKIEKDRNLPTDYTDKTYLSSANCDGATCVASGRYDDSAAKQYPMLAMSFDGGVTWAYKIEKGKNLPTNYYDNANITSANCNGSTCIVAGLYTASNSVYYPTLAISSDGGNTWTYKIEQNMNLPAGFASVSSNFFNGAYCSGTTCIAGGKYFADTGYPMLAVSIDNGATWTYKIDKENNLPTDYASLGYIRIVNCSGATCIGGGDYDASDGKVYPILTISTDGGKTWTYKVDKDNNLPTDHSNYSNFESVNCNGANCIAGGRYNDDNTDTFPMLAVSNDYGATWTYRIEKNINLPTGYFDSGSFDSASANNASYLPDSLKFINAPL